MTEPTREGPVHPRPPQDSRQNTDLNMESHRLSDSDSGPNSQHHTLGPGRNQAAPGDHIHDGERSKKIGTGDGNALAGAKGGNVALANLIAMLSKYVEFTDNTT